MREERGSIFKYIPQRAPFVMIDNLLDVKDGVYTSRFTIGKDNIFLDENALKEYALIENIAQTATAGIAFESQGKVEMLKEGYIGCISKLTIHNSVQVGAQLLTTTTKINEIGNLILISGNVYSSGELLIECNLHISKS
tara:strand:+ start:344 stop:760 length:417 start_codon:yes stop_codon:yes gene_type:complete